MKDSEQFTLFLTTSEYETRNLYYNYGGSKWQTNQNVFFFNEENIAEVLFMGYSDEDEEKFCTMFKEEIDKGNYPRLKLQIEGR